MTNRDEALAFYAFRCCTSGGCGQVASTFPYELTRSEAWVLERAYKCKCGGGLINIGPISPEQAKGFDYVLYYKKREPGSGLSGFVDSK